MTKSAIVDAVLKEAGFMDIVRSLASKFNIKIPTKQEALAKIKEYLSKDPKAINEALDYYHSTFAKHADKSEWELKQERKRPVSKTSIIIIVLLLSILGYKINEQHNANDIQRAVKDYVEAITNMPKIVTYQQYSKIQNGMTYEQVKSIIGNEGREISRGQGVEMYQWVNQNGSNMNAMFQNGKLTQKAQALLE